jgi:hypothetical protein
MIIKSNLSFVFKSEREKKEKYGVRHTNNKKKRTAEKQQQH